METLRGAEVVSAPPRRRSWQVAQEIFSSWPTGTLARVTGLFKASSWREVPEKAVSKKNFCPSWAAGSESDQRFDLSNGGGCRPDNAEMRSHSPGANSQPSREQNASSVHDPQDDAISAATRYH